MSSVNKVILVGNLGGEPVMRYSQAGTAVCNFSLATNEKWKSKDGSDQEKTEWHRIVAWGRTAEVCTEYLDKGSKVYIEGSLQTNEWEDKEGNKRTTTEVRCQRMVMLGGTRGSQEKKSAATPPPRGEQAPLPDDDEEVPF